jgi:hypothetical protein
MHHITRLYTLFNFLILFHKLGSSFECRCLKSCNKTNQTSPTQMRVVTSNKNKTHLGYEDFKFSKLKPIAKQGGSACYPSACMNGGTCFTNTNPTYYYSGNYASSTTAAPAYNPPLCVTCLS